MSDLISRSALIKAVEADINRCYVFRIDGVGALSHFIDQIKEQPTAFDIEEVVKELEGLKAEYKEGWDEGNHEDDYGAYFAIENAIEIVRKGGVK